MAVSPRLAFVPHINVYFSPPVASVIAFAVAFIPLLLILHYHEAKRRAAALQPKGCRRLGMPYGLSNFADEYDYTTDGTRKGAKTPADKIKIKALMTYPIKSCRGVELPVANVVSTGMEFDRNFCFAEYIEESEGVKGEKRPAHWAARTMRDSKFRKMTLIRPEIWVSDPASPTYSPRGRNALSKGVMIVRYPREIAEGTGFKGLMLFIAMKLGIARNEECFQVPLYPPPGHEYPSRKLRVWSDYPMAFDYGVHLPASLAKFVGATKPFTLLRVDPEYFRTVKRCAPTKDDLGFQVQTAFADVYPLNMQNVSSVRDVEKRVAHSIPKLTVRRYRPNIVLEGIPAYSEDDWKKIEVVPRKLAFNKGEKDSEDDDKRTLIHVVSRTPRCRLPNVDPDTGIRHPVEPDKTMRSFRCIDEGDPKKACLGMQLVPSVQEFELHVGDEIVVLEKGEHHYVN